MGGLDTYNVAPALTVAPIGRPTRKCIKHIRGARKAIPGGILSSIMKWDPEKKRLPIYFAQGTNDRFDAENNLNAKICSRAKAFDEGWKGGKATSLIQKDADLNEEDHQKRIDEASDEAKTLDAEAKKGKGKRKEFRQEQKEFEKQAKKLNDKQEKLALKAQRKNAKAATAAAAYVAEVTGKI